MVKRSKGKPAPQVVMVNGVSAELHNERRVPGFNVVINGETKGAIWSKLGLGTADSPRNYFEGTRYGLDKSVGGTGGLTDKKYLTIEEAIADIAGI